MRAFWGEGGSLVHLPVRRAGLRVRLAPRLLSDASRDSGSISLAYGTLVRAEPITDSVAVVARRSGTPGVQCDGGSRPEPGAASTCWPWNHWPPFPAYSATATGSPPTAGTAGAGPTSRSGLSSSAVSAHARCRRSSHVAGTAASPGSCRSARRCQNFPGQRGWPSARLRPVPEFPTPSRRLAGRPAAP